VQRHAGGKPGDLVAAGAERRKVTQLAAVGVRQLLEAIEIRTRVNAQQIAFGGHRSAAEVHLAGQPRDLHHGNHAALGLQRLSRHRVLRRLHPTADACDEGEAAGRAVPEASLVVKKAGAKIHDDLCLGGRNGVAATAALVMAPRRTRSTQTPFRWRREGHDACTIF